MGQIRRFVKKYDNKGKSWRTKKRKGDPCAPGDPYQKASSPRDCETCNYIIRMPFEELYRITNTVDRNMVILQAAAAEAAVAAARVPRSV